MLERTSLPVSRRIRYRRGAAALTLGALVVAGWAVPAAADLPSRSPASRCGPSSSRRTPVGSAP